MKTFACDHCGNLVFFENDQCLKCGHALGFLSDVLDLSALSAEKDNTWRAISTAANGRIYHQCQNGRAHQVCNWLVPSGDPEPFCTSCRLNKVIPNLDDTANRARWFKLEQAKRRLVYSLLSLGLSTDGLPAEGRPPLRFQFLASTAQALALTGHSDGLITLDIAEADDAERERRRVNLNEPYRTLLGHLRHEVGHYYWGRLIANTPFQARFRELFGDERADYAAALQNHYAQGPPADWPARHVSAYASAHPWEDWAETWAHYLHIIDTLETAASFGLQLKPRHPDAQKMRAAPETATSPDATFDQLLGHWFPLTYVLNSLSRGMGHPDLYPFVLSGPAVEKLHFIHDIVRGVQRAPGN